MPFDGTDFSTPAAPQDTRDPFNLYAFRDWLREQDGAREYSYVDVRQCLLCGYFRSAGFKVLMLGPGWFSETASDRMVPYPAVFNNISRGRPRTVAAALARCEAEIARREAE